MRRQSRDTNRNRKGWRTFDTDSKVKHFERWPFETLDFIIRLLAVHQPFYISIIESVLLCIHHTFLLSSTFQWYLSRMTSTIVFTFLQLCLALMLGIGLVVKTENDVTLHAQAPLSVRTRS